MDFNERFITGTDNQGPWPLLRPASVQFRAKGFSASPNDARPENQKASAGGAHRHLGRKHESDSQSGAS
jgi:hypothetical protein